MRRLGAAATCFGGCGRLGGGATTAPAACKADRQSCIVQLVLCLLPLFYMLLYEYVVATGHPPRSGRISPVALGSADAA